ncbi:class I SAM-dependent methyltransferase [Acetobacterium carbinolicum]|uniref:class I SAM-dependent methyltransferase n=1 Tax=Acetobacterium carbinolicum TaxID=52690 RepID=UPI0039C8C47A
MNVKSFEHVVNNIFAPIYPVIAENIINETGITRGVCIDVGTGFGNLGLELAKLTPDIETILFDLSDEMLKEAQQNCVRMMLSDRVRIQQGNVEQLPFEDNMADLIISRGSIFFWDDQVKGVNEIYRVLKPEGYAYIGGGFGNQELLLQVSEKMEEHDPEWKNDRKKRAGEKGYVHFENMMKQTDISHYEVSRKQAGLWIIFKK